jgi:flagellar biosynthesis component FlhA
MKSGFGRSENEMSVAEQTAVSNLSITLGKLRWIILLQVMGVLIVMTAPFPAMTTDLPAGLDITLSVTAMPVLVYTLQPVHLSGLPSLLPIFAFLQCLVWISVTLFRGAENTGVAGDVGKPFGQFSVAALSFLNSTVLLALIVIYFKHIKHGSMGFPELTPKLTAESSTPDFALSQQWMGNPEYLRGMGGEPMTNSIHSLETIWIQG